MMSVLDLDFIDNASLRALTAAGVAVFPTDLRGFDPLRLPLEASLSLSLLASATTIKRGLLTPVELMGGLEPLLTFLIGSESFFVEEGGLGGRAALMNDLMLVSLLLPPRDVPLPRRAAVGDFLANLTLEEGDFDVSFAEATVRFVLGLGLPLTARWNTGENSGEVVGEGESGRPDCVTTSLLDCSETGEVGSNIELDLKSAGATTSLSPPSPSPPLLLLLLLDVLGVAMEFSFFSTSESRFSMLMFILADSVSEWGVASDPVGT